jgi:hypothetical protein
MGQRSPSDVRLRAALQFSSLSLVVMLVMSSQLTAEGDRWRGHAFAVVGLALALACVYGYVALLAALAERRPAMRSRVGRRVWAWAFFLWLVVGWMGWRVHASQSIGATTIVAASEFILFSGAVGLTYALFGRGAGIEQ